MSTTLVKLSKWAERTHRTKDVTYRADSGRDIAVILASRPETFDEIELVLYWAVWAKVRAETDPRFTRDLYSLGTQCGFAFRVLEMAYDFLDYSLFLSELEHAKTVVESERLINWE